ncbi:MAG: amino acid adenylation domain-containing protein [Desulfobacterales bacterium]|nr:amino acid adenylation domain-containing protein [Desulfobacterales bacterium]
MDGYLETNKTTDIVNIMSKNHPDILDVLKNTIKQITYILPEDLEIDADLFQIGLDSLMIAQLQQAIRKTFGVEIEMNQFVSEASTVRKITQYIEQNLPQDFFSKEEEKESEKALQEKQYTDSSMIERIMKEQMQTMSELMAKQLEVLGGKNVEQKWKEKKKEIKESKKVEKREVVVPGLYRKISTEKRSNYSQRQITHMLNLAKSYNSKTARSKAYAEDFRSVFAHSRSILYRPEMKEMTYLTALESASGARFKDIDGNEYIDITMGFGVALLGHNPTFVKDSLIEELSRGPAIGPVSRLAGDVANLIHELTGVERVAFFNTGAEAVMVAIRLARTVTGRNKIVIFSGSWHGSFDSVLASGWLDNDGEPLTFPIAPGITQNIVNDVIVLKYGDSESLKAIHKYGHELAAVVTEPVQSRHPDLQPREFIQELRKITQETGTALIFDEVITGFRSHIGGAQAYFDVKADLVTYGKIVGGGIAIGVVSGKSQYMDAIDGGVWKFGDESVPCKQLTVIAGTFNIHPLAMAAAKAVLTHLKSEGQKLQEDLNLRVKKLCEELNRWFNQEDIPIHMVYFSSLFRFVLPPDSEIFFFYLLNRGVFVWEGRNCFLSTAHTDKDISYIIDMVKQSVIEMRKGGWLPEGKTKFSGSIPLSEGQRQMWFLIQSEPLSSYAYNEIVQLKFEGNIDKVALEKGISHIITRHEMMRVTSIDGENQNIADSIHFELPCINIAYPENIKEFISKEACKPFNLSFGPFWRFHLLQISQKEHILLIIGHHMIFDGWSIALLIKEIEELYSSYINNRPDKLSETVSYKSYIEWENSQLLTEGDYKYWQSQFEKPIPVLELPSDYPRLSRPTYRGKRYQLIIRQDNYEKLSKFSRNHGVSLFMTLLGAFNVWLAKLSCEKAFMITLPVAGQSNMGKNNLIGQCTRMLPFVVTITQDILFTKLLNETKIQLMESQTHRYNQAAIQNKIPVPTVVFNMDKAFSIKFEELYTSLEPVEIQFVKFDLFLNAIEIGKELILDFDYSTDLFKTATIEKWAEDFEKLLYQLLGNPETPIKILHTDSLRVDGFKVVKEEIEKVLIQNKSVAKALVTTIENHPDKYDATLIAYLIPAPNKNIRIRSLRLWLNSILPSYKVPDYFAIVDHFPETPYGEIDYTALLNMDIDKETGKNVYISPSNNTQILLANLWSDILKIKQVGLYDHFFELGGQSLHAIQVISRLKDHFQIEIPLRKFFETPVLADFAKIIDDSKKDAASVYTILPVSRDGKMLLSFAQYRLWFLDQMEGPSATYNLPEALRLTGELNIKALEKAYNEIIRRHESLRTTFSEISGEPVQLMSPFIFQPLISTDISHISKNSQEKEVLRLFNDYAKIPFDLKKGPLFKMNLLILSKTEHVLLANIHHIIADGWSEGILLDEFAILYTAFSENKTPLLKELPVQYADFAHFQREMFSRDMLSNDLNYWKKELSGANELLELPTDRPRPNVQTFSGSIEPFEIDPHLTYRFKNLLQGTGASLFMGIYSIFAVLLSRYSGQEDIVIGSAVANRIYKEIEQIIGFFVNMLPLRTDLSDNPDFYMILDRVKQTTLDGYAHQSVPFEKLVEVIQPKRSMSYTPIFQVALAFQNIPANNLKIPNLNITKLPLPSDLNSKFDLTLFLEEADFGLKGFMEYNTDLFEKATIGRMIRHFIKLMEGIVEHPEKQIFEIPMITESEKYQLIKWNDTKQKYPDKCIQQLFEIQAEIKPDDTAIFFKNEQMTFKELNIKANKFAHYLKSESVGPDVIVGISIDRSPKMIVALLGILKAGGVCLPLDPNYPKERIDFMIKDSKTSIIISDTTFEEKWEKVEQYSSENPIININPESLAFLNYTSGSTGLPKGVISTHRGYINRFNWMWRMYPFEKGEICSQKTSLNFADSLWEIFGSLLCGVPVVVIPDEDVKDPIKLVKALAHKNVTRIVLVPSLLRAILDTDKKLSKSLPKLKYWTTSGEAISKELFKRFKESCPDSILLNLYGSSEVSADSTWFDTQEKDIFTSVPIGRPIDNTQIYLLDKYMQQVPVGVPGELYIGGLGLAKGYLGRPELTDEKFIKNPLTDEPSERLYRTGDIARYLPDGNIEYLGRIDRQVKLRGFRIELGEIEAKLSLHPDINQNIVLQREDIVDEKRLVAYILTSNKKIDIIQLRSFLRESLPEYMIPSAFVLLDKMPLLPNGKIDCKALPQPDISSFQENLYTAPRNSTEEALSQIWSETLNLERIGIHDNFFDLGGHSLLAVRLISRIREKFLIELTVRNLFTAFTIAKLAEYIDAIVWVTNSKATDAETEYEETGRI